MADSYSCDFIFWVDIFFQKQVVSLNVTRFLYSKQYCYKYTLASGEPLPSNLGVNFNKSPVLELLNFPSFPFQFNTCIWNTVSSNPDFADAISIIETKDQKSSLICDGSESFNFGCFPEEEFLENKSARQFDLAFPHTCPNYLSDIEHYGASVTATADVIFSKSLRHPIYAFITLFFGISTLWWGWLLLLTNLQKNIFEYFEKTIGAKEDKDS